VEFRPRTVELEVLGAVHDVSSVAVVESKLDHLVHNNSVQVDHVVQVNLVVQVDHVMQERSIHRTLQQVTSQPDNNDNSVATQPIPKLPSTILLSTRLHNVIWEQTASW